MKFHIETYGCTTNRFDSEALAGLLVEAGHGLVGEEEAELIIVNTCTVVNTTKQKILHRISEIQKPLLVAGCMAQVQKEEILGVKPGANLLGTFAISKVADVAGRIMAGEQVVELGKHDKEKAGLPCHHFDGKAVPVAISRGCIGSCTYCITRLARGRLESFSVESVVGAVKKAVEGGAEEIQLTSQDNGAYGVDIGTDLAELLKRVVQIPGDFKIRVGMMNPSGALKILPKLVEAYKLPKIRRFLHVPVQSGSDKVLGEMKRDYGVADFEKIVSEFREHFPGISIATDVIVGYPTESEADFRHTVTLLERARPEVLNITRYSPRPGTESAQLNNIDTKVAKERSRDLTELFRAQLGKSSEQGE